MFRKPVSGAGWEPEASMNKPEWDCCAASEPAKLRQAARAQEANQVFISIFHQKSGTTVQLAALSEPGGIIFMEAVEQTIRREFSLRPGRSTWSFRFFEERIMQSRLNYMRGVKRSNRQKVGLGEIIRRFDRAFS
jgi:hypothetical protein